MTSSNSQNQKVSTKSSILQIFQFHTLCFIFHPFVGTKSSINKFLFVSEFARMLHHDYIELLNKVCRVPFGTDRGSLQSDKCFLELFHLHEKVGLKSAELYEEINRYSSEFLQSFDLKNFPNYFYCH